MTIFALNIMPYISASIIIQLLTAVSPQLEALKKEGESGRKKLNQYTRYGTVLLAAVQAYGIAVGLEGMRSAGAVGGDRSGLFLPHRHGDHADRRHRLPDVARRADHRARRRQRHLADHLLRHRRPPAARARRNPRTRPHRRAVALLHHPVPGDGGGGRRLHRLHGARAAPHPGAISEAPGRQQHVRRRGLASAAEAQHLGRDPADLRLLAAAAAGARSRASRQTAPASAGSARSPPIWRTASRSTWCSTSA